MTDMRRTLLWMIFAVSLMMLWDAWNKHNGHPTVMGMPVPQSVAASGPAGTSGASSAAAGASSHVAHAAAPAATPASAAPAEAERVTITTDVVKATIDTEGASLVRIELLKHHDEKDKNKNIVVLDKTDTHTYVAQSGLFGVSAEQALPNHTTVFNIETTARTLDAGSDQLEVRLASQPINGVKLIKTYTFKRGDYAIGVRHEVVNTSTAAMRPSLYLQLQRDGSKPQGSQEPSFFGGPQAYAGMAVYNAKGKYQKVDFESIDKGKAEFEKTDDNGWVAMVQLYFASAWLQNDKVPREFFSKKVNTQLYATGMLFGLGEIAAGQSKRFDASLFVGPQEENVLSKLAPGLEYTKDYGWTHVIAAPLFWLLDKLHAMLSNWGWAIVALVVLLKVAFYGLNASAYRSMAKMKAVNPKIQEMRERLKSDPQKMQQEMMRIYREEKVNPLGGCLPIVIQIPVFIALYSVLSSSVEIRNAPWIGWITDLSVKDPYYVLPALMTLSTLLQTWLNPTPPDPMQAKMMWIMPLLFSVMFFFFPAGLVLYWLTNNVLSIAQQWMINRQLGVTN